MESCLIEIEDEKDIIWHQVDMIANNPQLGIYEPVYLQKDERQYLLYDTENEVSLSGFLKSQKVTGEFVVDLISNICKAVLKSEEYLLNEQKFVFSADYIYLIRNTNGIKLIYLPIANSKFLTDSKLGVKDMVIDIIFQKASILDGEENLKSSFRELMSVRDVTVNALEKLCIDSRKHINSKYVEIEGLGDKETPSNKYIEQLFNEDGEEEQIEKTENYKALFPHLIIVALLGVVEFTPITQYIQLKWIESKVLFFLLIGLVEIVILLYPWVKKRINKQDNETGSACENTKPDKKNISNNSINYETEKTINLFSVDRPMAFLVEKNNSNPLKAEMHNDIFNIGRDVNKNNLVCSNKTVGKTHAQIKFEDGQYFLTDLGSTNGTRINGERIQPGDSKKIVHSDTLSFANMDFVFMAIMEKKSNLC